jgi:hypothetical protein
MKLLERIARARAGLIELVAVALLLALAINLASSGLVAWLGLPLAALTGVALAIATVAVLAWSQMRSRHETIEYVGFIPTHDGIPVKVRGYALATDVERALRAVMSENEALKMQWDDQPLVLPKTEDSSGKDRRNIDGGAARLLREALEYAFLENLSTHLSSYFDDDAWLANNTKELVRDDLLELLPQNRVLDALSRPIEDRLALIENKEGNDTADQPRIKITRLRETADGPEETVVSVFSGDFLYSRFDLSVPKDVTVHRVGPGCVRLDGRYMRTELGVGFDGFVYTLDPEFLDGYLGLDSREFFNGDRVQVWRVTLSFSSQLRWRSLLSARSWRLQRWAEAFANEAKVQFDGAAFLDSISWSTISALMRTERGVATAARRRQSERDDSRSMRSGEQDDEASPEASATGDRATA